VQAMDKEKSSGHDETQALAAARAKEELLKKFQMMKQKVQRSPTGMEQTPDAHPVPVQMFNFGNNEDEETTSKRSREPTSPEETSLGAHKKGWMGRLPHKTEKGAQAMLRMHGIRLHVCQMPSVSGNSRQTLLLWK